MSDDGMYLDTTSVTPDSDLAPATQDIVLEHPSGHTSADYSPGLSALVGKAAAVEALVQAAIYDGLYKILGEAYAPSRDELVIGPIDPSPDGPDATRFNEGYLAIKRPISFGPFTLHVRYVMQPAFFNKNDKFSNVAFYPTTEVSRRQKIDNIGDFIAQFSDNALRTLDQTDSDNSSRPEIPDTSSSPDDSIVPVNANVYFEIDNKDYQPNDILPGSDPQQRALQELVGKPYWFDARKLWVRLVPVALLNSPADEVAIRCEMKPVEIKPDSPKRELNRPTHDWIAVSKIYEPVIITARRKAISTVTVRVANRIDQDKPADKAPLWAASALGSLEIQRRVTSQQEVAPHQQGIPVT